MDNFKLGAQDVSVLAHMLHHAVNILKEPDVAQLVHLVVANGLHLHLGADIHQVILGGG